jgi:hypothetical protein
MRLVFTNVAGRSRKVVQVHRVSFDHESNLVKTLFYVRYKEENDYFRIAEIWEEALYKLWYQGRSCEHRQRSSFQILLSLSAIRFRAVCVGCT